MLESDPNNDKAFKSVIDAPRSTEHAIQLSYYQIGKRLSARLSEQMLAKDKTGRTYFIKTRSGRRRHIASAEGQTAANRTGRMRKARSFSIRGMQLEFGIKGAPYAKYLEKNMNRPTLKNTIDSTERDVENEFLRNLERELR